MSLEGTVNNEKPSEQTPQPKQSKTARARELALKYKDEPPSKARKLIAEEVPCSRSVASKAVKYVKKKVQAEKTPKKPKMEVVSEQEKKPKFIEPPEATTEETAEQPIEEIQPITPAAAEVSQEELDVFRDMLRGLHVLIVAKGGLTDLLLKAGVSEKQAKDTSDQLYRWLCRRYGAEDLQRWDTIILVASYGTLVGSLIQQVIANRPKQSPKGK